MTLDTVYLPYMDEDIWTSRLISRSLIWISSLLRNVEWSCNG